MKNLLFAGVAGLSMFVAAPAMAASDSFVAKAEKGGAPYLGGVVEGRRGGGGHPPIMPGVHRPHPGPGPGMGGNHRWGHRMGGRWFVGFHAPGGWGGYRVPNRGYVLPTYWINPSYRIVNYPQYGLYAPQTGYGWTRYYDDAVLSDSRGHVQDYRSNIPWDRYEGGYAPGDYAEPQYGPAMGADRGVYYGDDRVYSNDYDYDTPPEVEYRSGTGEQDYREQDYGAPYANAGYPPAPMPAQAYQSRYGFERYERCLKERGIAGGLIGGIVGAVIGNRVAGRGDRTIGTILGGVAGGVAGVSIEKAANKCKKHLPRDDRYYSGNGYPQQGQGYPPPPPPQYYPPQQQPYPYPQQGGGYYHQGWYYPAPVVTTVTIMPAVTTTTTVTEEVYYETVAVPAKKKVVRKWKPKPKPRCVCR
jgi:hypothetical protein